jgi:hypothetical protein
LYIGVVAFILALVAWIKRKQVTDRNLLSIATLTALCAFVLALGINPHWLGKQVMSLPVVLQHIFHRVDMPQINLPAYYLFKYLPFFSKMRVMMRFGLFTLIFSSMMAGLGTHLLLKGSKDKFRRWVGIGLLVLVFVDFYPGVFTQFATLDARPVDYWLAVQPDTGALAQFPFNEEKDQYLLYVTLVNQKPYLGGLFSANEPEQYRRIQPVMDGFPSMESLDLLRKLGVTYVVVDSSAYTDYPAIDQDIRSLGLLLLHIDGSDYVYGLP